MIYFGQTPTSGIPLTDPGEIHNLPNWANSGTLTDNHAALRSYWYIRCLPMLHSGVTGIG